MTTANSTNASAADATTTNNKNIQNREAGATDYQYYYSTIYPLFWLVTMGR